MSTSKKLNIVLLTVFVLSLLLYLTRNKDVSSVDDIVLSSTADSFITDSKVTSNSSSDNANNQRIVNLEQQVKHMSSQQNEMIDNMKKVIALANEKSNGSESSKDIQAENNSVTQQLSPLEKEQATIQQEEQQFAQVESDFDIESRDDAWSVNEENKIRSVLDNEKLGQASIESIDCRSKTCRAELGHNDQAAADDFMDAFLRSMGNNSSGELRFRDNGEGGVNTIMYIKPSEG